MKRAETDEDAAGSDEDDEAAPAASEPVASRSDDASSFLDGVCVLFYNIPDDEKRNLTKSVMTYPFYCFMKY